MSTGTPNGVGADAPSDVDRRSIWPVWTRNQEWRERLAKKASHKALDIPDDEMEINANKTGIGTLGAIGIAGAAGLGPTILGTAMLLSNGDEAPVAPQQAPAIVAPLDPADSEYEVRFYDKDGNPIQVPHIGEK